MDDKDNALQNLKKVKLILGNGFDLFCGLKTSYSDYFECRKDIYKLVDDWITKMANDVIGHPEDRDKPGSYYRSDPCLERVNCWDLFFIS